MILALLLTLTAEAGAPESPLVEGVYDFRGSAVTVGKGGKTFAFEDGAPSKVTVVAPNAITTADGTTWAVVVLGDRMWTASFVLVGTTLSTDGGYAYTWAADGCTTDDPDAASSAPSCETQPTGLRYVNGSVLHQRAPDVWTTEAVPMPRGTDAKDAHAKARFALADDGVAAAVAAAKGDWVTSYGDTFSIAGAKRTEAHDGSVTELLPMAPCLVGGEGEDATTTPFWSDGKRFAEGDVAVTRGDVVWGCEPGIVVRFVGADCEGYSWVPPNGWYADDRMCGGSKAGPATFRITFAPTEVPGVWAQGLSVRPSAAPAQE